VKRVVIESPFKTVTFDLNGQSFTLFEEGNLAYARAAAHDCLVNHGEAPWASHLLYPQPGILRDDVAEERVHGITAGLVWSECAEKCVVYIDRGITEGMRKYGIPGAEKKGQPIEYRRIGVLAIPEFADLTPEQLIALPII